MNTTVSKPGSTVAMRSAAFTFLLIAASAAALWLALRLIITTDPENVGNVVLFLFALFLSGTSLGALCAWVFWARRWEEPKRYQVALRQGTWFGAIAVLAALLQIWHLLSWLAVGAMILMFGGLEALFLLQSTPRRDLPTDE